MTQPTLQNRPFRTQRARPLSGTFTVSGDPAIAERALLVAAMAQGESRLRRIGNRHSVVTMAESLRQLGAVIDLADGDAMVFGLGVGGLLEPVSAIDGAGLGDGAALLFGAAGIHAFETRFAGLGRPTGPLADALEALGVRIRWNADRPGPLTMRGPSAPLPGPYTAASRAAKDALLMAAIAIPGTTKITEPIATFDHTEHVLAAFGAQLETTESGTGRTLTLGGLPPLTGRDIVIAGDPGLSAAALVAGLIVPGSEVAVDTVLLNPYRTAMVQTLLEMGADLKALERSVSGGEEMAVLAARHGQLSGISIPAERVAAMGEELPFLLLAASYARGDSVFQEIAALEAENGWLAAVTQGFAAAGASWERNGPDLVVHGQGRLRGGGTIPGHPDPRVPLTFLLAGMASRDPITVQDPAGLVEGFGNVLEGLAALGARFKRES